MSRSLRRAPRAAFAPLAALALGAPLACGEAGGGAPPDGTGGAGAGTPGTGGGGGTGGTGTGTGGSGGSGGTGGGGTGGTGGMAPADPFATGAELRVPVTVGARAFVRLDPLGLVAPTDPATAADWDLAFEGYGVYTNGGVSGAGAGTAFGPLDITEFATPPVPLPPISFDDRTGGAFLRWYKYSGGPDHVLYSRYHVFGVKDGDLTWKVQILTYYTPYEGYPTPAIYTLRYASVGPTGAGPTQKAIVDGTGANPTPGDTSAECLDLATGQKPRLTPEQALASTAWHLCFRREVISVNGGLGGPRGVAAVDFDAAQTNGETIEQLKPLTAESELPRFEALTFDRFASANLQGDRVVSAFDPLWLDATSTPPAPAPAAWLVTAADGTTKHLVGFASFDGATTATPGTIVLRAKRVGP
ncbi:MAG TPA: HmuY family protein [Polyangiaceae bacterium]|nr:HmuY family protein [Polyangiaceae bacterium]